MATLSAKLNPFKNETSLLPVCVGPNVVDVIDQSGLTFKGPINAVIVINGQMIPRERWEMTFPGAGDLIELHVVPHGGGGGKDPLKTILSLALMIAAPFAGPAIAGLFGGSLLTFAGMGVAGTLAMYTGLTLGAGFLALNALFPPPKIGDITSRSGQDLKRSESYSIAGARNRIEPYAAIPLNLGRNRVHPPYAAKPYTELVGTDQYLRCLFLIGYGPNKITSLKIGETDLTDYDNVEYYVHEDFDPEADDLELWSETVDEQQFNIELLEAESWSLRTTEIGADEISIDITLPQGLIEMNKDGTKDPLTVQYEVQYSPKDADAWSIGAAGEAFLERTVTIPNPTLKNNYYRVVMKRDDGSLEVLTGIEGYWGPEVTVESAPPPIPSWAVPVCLVFRTRDVNVTNAIITDERTNEAKRNNANDFLPHQDDPVSSDVIIDAGTFYNYITLNEKTTDVIRVNHRFKATGDLNGQYDVRVRRTTADHVSATKFDSIYWTALRGITHEQPVDTNYNVSLVELRIKATNNLQGVIDQFNCIAFSEVADWDKDTSTWIERTSNIPASLYRHVLQSPAHKQDVADAKIDLTVLQTWHEDCQQGHIFGTLTVDGAFNIDAAAIEVEAAASSSAILYAGARIKFAGDDEVYELTDDSGLIEAGGGATLTITPGLVQALIGGEEVTLLTPSMSFNQYVDYQCSVDDLLSLIASSARATKDWYDGKYSIIQDKEKTTPVQHFTPRNSWGFSGKRMFPELPHAWRVRFRNEDKGYRDDEVIVYNNGYDKTGSGANEVATKFETLELPGKTDYQDAYRLARYFIRQLVLRPEEFGFYADVENLVCRRGALVLFSHDVPIIGLASGRIKELLLDAGDDIEGVIMDEVMPMEVGKTYSLRFRQSDGTTLLASVVTDAGDQTEVYFSEVIPAVSAPAVGDLGMFGETAEETLECLVKIIEPGDDLTAKIVLVPYSPEIFDLDDEEIPEYEAMISDLPGVASPVIADVRSDEYVMVRDASGHLQPRIVVTFSSVYNRDFHTISHIQGQYRVTPGTVVDDYKSGEPLWTELPRIPKDATEVSIAGVEQGASYDLRFRYLYYV